MQISVIVSFTGKKNYRERKQILKLLSIDTLAEYERYNFDKNIEKGLTAMFYERFCLQRFSGKKKCVIS